MIIQTVFLPVFGYSGYDCIPDRRIGIRNLLGAFSRLGCTLGTFRRFLNDSDRRRGAAIFAVAAPPKSRKSLESEARWKIIDKLTVLEYPLNAK